MRKTTRKVGEAIFNSLNITIALICLAITAMAFYKSIKYKVTDPCPETMLSQTICDGESLYNGFTINKENYLSWNPTCTCLVNETRIYFQIED